MTSFLTCSIAVRRRNVKTVTTFLLLVALPSVLLADAMPVPHWIWVNANRPRSRTGYLTKSFTAPKEPVTTELTGVADFCAASLYLNGQLVGTVEDYSPRFRFDVTEHIKPGRNVIAVAAKSHSGPAAVALRLRLSTRDRKQTFVITDASWKASPKAVGRLRKQVPADWKPAADLGRLASEPWGDHPDTVTIKALDDYTQWKQALGDKETADPTGFFTQDGFQIELLRSAKSDEGSWISIAFDPKGRLIVSREDKGLLRFTLNGKNCRVSKVETVNDSLLECRGLLFAHGALYANANNSFGLYRLRDTNGDDRFDEVKLLRKMPGGKGHGRNDLTLGPDGMIYAIHGDAVEVPPKLPNRKSPLRVNSRKGRRGFVMRIDRDGKQAEIVTTGMRNPYGIAFNPAGEMFTYDADAEYDMGSPWYRPTRILQLLPGGDFGWRAVTKTWPPYNPDNPDAAPPALDIGKGSPTAVQFGTRSKFPPKYQRALFASDWAYGRILAVHMTPRGAGYAMRAETFLKGRPFNVTDITFGPDGAMYLTTGGRKTQSGLYRVSYVGRKKGKEAQPTMQQRARERFSAEARKLRRQLETLQNAADKSAIDTAWPHLDNPDPFLRYAARIAVEHQPVKLWRDRALSEKKPLAALTALLSLAQVQNESDASKIVGRLKEFPLNELPRTQQIIALRIFDLVLAGEKGTSSPIQKSCLARLLPHYPIGRFDVDRRLSALLVQLQAPGIVAKTMKLLETATTQKQQFHCLYVLRNVREGWTPELRTRYFQRLSRMSNYLGGEGMPSFISRIQSEAVKGLSKQEQKRLAPLLARSTDAIEIPPEAKGRKFVQEWKAADLSALLSRPGKRCFERGRTMFDAAVCSACHRIGRHGRAIGPDLTSVGRRFSRRDILQSILDPSKVVAEQYRRDIIITSQGKSYIGSILEGGDYRSPQLRIITDPLKPDGVVTIVKADIETHRKSPTSIMPKGLLNTLSREEILDLLAYLESGGDRRHPVFSAGGRE